MRLIQTNTLQLEEFFDDRIPRYAILSHTWGDEEVSLQDMLGGKATAKAGFVKIKHATAQAAKDDYDYVWVDTCCIDKSSSAELSEAINSMYKWYENAGICYAFLEDYDHNEEKIIPFVTSRWFTRGWTLQELIAPPEVEFYDTFWAKFGTRNSLVIPLEMVTGIDIPVLNGTLSLTECSIAKRMSWASKRQTTRAEDVAYSLMGIFDINMPLLYGEGIKAFTRLLEEIIKNSDDHSIFAWEAQPDGTESNNTSLLAESPAEYIDSHDYVPFRTWGDSVPYVMTNKGLSIQLELREDNGVYKAALNCWRHKNSSERICIQLRKLEGDQYVRLNRSRLNFVDDQLQLVTIFVRKNPLHIQSRDIVRSGVQFKLTYGQQEGKLRLLSGYPQNRMDMSSGCYFAPFSRSIGAVELYRSGNERSVFAIFGAELLPSEAWCMFLYGTKAKMIETMESVEFPRIEVGARRILQGCSHVLEFEGHIFSATVRYQGDVLRGYDVAIKAERVKLKWQSKWGF